MRQADNSTTTNHGVGVAMNPKAEALLRRSKEKLEAAQVLLSRHSEGGPVSFAYFAMFHAATAMALAEGRTFPACSGWLAAFGEAFAATGKVDRKFHQDLVEAYRLRQIADYDWRGHIPDEVAESTLKKATEFVAMAEEFLGKAGGEDA
jgi:uncharacterized protein (UPF0332 family)